MKQYTILGNCQTHSISKRLNSALSFSDEYEYRYLPPVHTIDIKKDIHLLDILKKTDLLIYQPVLDEKRFGPFTSDNIKKIIRKDTIVICIPSMYYGGYFPTIESIEGINATLRGVHDFVIAACYLASKTIGETIELLTKNFILDLETIRLFHHNSINSLRQREKQYNVDIEISSYISENFQDRRLFHTFNHPSIDMVKFICSEILEKLGIEDTCTDDEDILDFIKAPIYNSVYDALGLSFKNVEMERDSKEIELSFMVKNDFEIYKKSSQPLILNKLVHKKKFLLTYFPELGELDYEFKGNVL